MFFKQWLEVYSKENNWLKQYLQSTPIDLASNFHSFLEWRKADKILKRLKIDRDHLEEMHEDGSDQFYSVVELIEKSMTAKEKSDFVEDIVRMYPAEAPSWSHLDFHKIVPRQTWLVHFSDDAHNISWKGFSHGISDMTKLGLTTYFGKEAKKYGGYNFAFEATSHYARNAAKKKKYGKHAVLFQASGVQAFHYGDEEDQIIFWGPAIAPGSMVHLLRTDDVWCVVPENAKRECLYTGEFNDVVNWVITNHHQYRKRLFSPPPKDWYKKTI